MVALEVWSALFALALVGVLILYLSSRQLQKTERFHRRLLDRQREMEEKQSAFLAKISENIHEIVEETYKEVAAKNDSCLPEEVKEKEKELLNVTGDLLEFLRLKSKKVDIIHEKLNLNNVLNEVAGRLGNTFKGKNVEVIFDIDNTIPRYLLGDARNLEKALYGLLEFMIDRADDGEVIVEISIFKSFDESTELQFKFFDDGEITDADTIEKLFIPHYDEEKKTYVGLGLYVAKSLIELMGGSLAIDTKGRKGTTILATLPFEIERKEERRNYRLPTKALTAKKVLICDTSVNAALALKKMFAYFRHDVTVLDAETFLRKKVPLATYDIILLHTGFLKYKKIVGALEHAKKKNELLKIVALDSLLKRDTTVSLPEAVDATMVKPVSQERVYELIIYLYTPRDIAKDDLETEADNGLIHRGELPSKRNVSQASFSDFSGMRLLIVEDDVVNQKVLLNILKGSGIDITLAANGWQAVNTVKESREPFDVVLMDINMPIMDGYTATRMIKEDDDFATLPVIAFTALALEDERHKIFESGMNAFLTKPLDIGKLYSAFELFYGVHNGGKRPEAKKSGATTLVRNEVIDMQAGLRHANGNEGLYAEVLKEFLEAYGESDRVFATLVKEHRYEQLKLLLLDMKGLSATVGAGEIYALASKIYKKLIYGETDTMDTFIEPYRMKLRALRLTIEKYLYQKEKGNERK
jgi:CheY-like chemotaxis protein